jgi:hypothetical protein
VNRRSFLGALAAIPVALGLSGGKAAASESEPALSYGYREPPTWDAFGTNAVGGRALGDGLAVDGVELTIRADQERRAAIVSGTLPTTCRYCADVILSEEWTRTDKGVAHRACIRAEMERRAAEAAGRAFPDGAPGFRSVPKGEQVTAEQIQHMIDVMTGTAPGPELRLVSPFEATPIFSGGRLAQHEGA